MSVVVFFLGLVMISLPFIPMLMEIVKKSDLSPLQISNQTLKDPRSVPDYVFWYLAHLLKVNGLIELKEKVSVSVSTMVGDSLLAIPAGIMTKLDVAAHTKVARVISAGKIILPDYSNHIQKILSLDSIQTGVENNLNEVHAHHLLTIGKKNKVIWWATAENVILQAEAHLPGKVQARKEIVFENGAQFHLLQGALIKSRINFESGSAENQELIKTPSTHIPHKLTISKNHTILDQVVFDGTLIVKGNLTLGKGSRVLGDLKVYGKLMVEEGAQIKGNVFSFGNIRFRGNNLVGGTLVTNRQLRMGPCTQVGFEDRKITVSAKSITIDGPFKVYGLLRAWKSGTITSSAL